MINSSYTKGRNQIEKITLDHLNHLNQFQSNTTRARNLSFHETYPTVIKDTN